MNDNSKCESDVDNKQRERARATLQCKICRAVQANILYLPCGHIIKCDKCPMNNRCEECGTWIKENHTIYM